MMLFLNNHPGILFIPFITIRSASVHLNAGLSVTARYVSQRGFLLPDRFHPLHFSNLGSVPAEGEMTP